MRQIICTLVIFSFGIRIATAQIQADFELDIAEGCVPLTVNFENKSTGSGSLSYFWDFGNGHQSHVEQPAEIYTNSGVFSVTLIVCDGTMKDTLFLEDAIVVHATPIVEFEEKNDTVGCVPLLIDFQNLSISQVAIESYIWDFGDGTICREQNPVHTYNASGVFDVILSVTDSNGCSGYARKLDLIETHKPEASFSANRTSSCTAFLNVEFTNQSTGDTPVSYNWAFGDGTFGTGTDEIHDYTQEGAYSVSLIVTDAFNCRDTLMIPNYISVKDIQADFSMSSDTVCLDELITFTNQSEQVNTFLWDFGDSVQSTNQNPVHSYRSGGLFTVALFKEIVGDALLSLA